MLWRLAYGMSLWTLGLGGLIGLMIWSYYSVYYGDSPPFSIERSKRFAIEGAFEQGRLKTNCVKADYSMQTRNLCNDNSCVIYFTPIQAKQAACPVISVDVDRKAGETWVSEKPATEG